MWKLSCHKTLSNHWKFWIFANQESNRSPFLQCTHVYQELVQCALLRGPYPLVTVIWLYEFVNVHDISKTLGLMCPQLRFLQGAQIYYGPELAGPFPLRAYALPTLQLDFRDNDDTHAWALERYHTHFSEISVELLSNLHTLHLWLTVIETGCLTHHHPNSPPWPNCVHSLQISLAQKILISSKGSHP